MEDGIGTTEYTERHGRKREGISKGRFEISDGGIGNCKMGIGVGWVRRCLCFVMLKHNLLFSV